MGKPHLFGAIERSMPQAYCASYRFRGLRQCQNARLISTFKSASRVELPANKSESGLGPSGNGRFNKDESSPRPLSHPLGLPYPPEPGQNMGVSGRSLRQRKDELMSREKHMERRIQLAKEFSKPYFRDWTKTRHHKGKTFLSNLRLIRSDKALYFPNLFGRTLDRSSPLQHTTPVLRGHLSVVSIFSSLWAERQTASFVGSKENPLLHRMIQDSDGVAQRVEINAEDNWLKALLIRIFMGNMRKKLPETQHGRYFLVTKGFTEHLKEQIGIMNKKVGYVYLLDSECRIRWAGSSIAASNEMESLNNGLRRLIEENRKGDAEHRESRE